MSPLVVDAANLPGRVSSPEPAEQVRALRERRAEVAAGLHAAKAAVELCRAELRHIDASICAVWDGKTTPARTATATERYATNEETP